MEYSPQEPYKLPNIARETGAAKVYSSNVHMNKSAGAYDSLLPNLTESESESDSESEPEFDQEYIMEETSLKHQPDSDLDTTNNANASEKESDKANLKDDHDPTMVAKMRTKM